MTGKELIKELMSFFEKEEIDFDSFCYDDLSEAQEAKVKELFGEYELVLEEGGGEGEGEHVEHVWHFKDHDVYIQALGNYQSYNGTEWDGDFNEVRPKEVMVIQYEKVPE